MQGGGSPFVEPEELPAQGVGSEVVLVFPVTFSSFFRITISVFVMFLMRFCALPYKDPFFKKVFTVNHKNS